VLLAEGKIAENHASVDRSQSPASPGTGRLAPSLCSAAARFRFSTSIFSVSTWAAALAQVFSTFHKKNAGASI